MKVTFCLRNAHAKKPTPINAYVHWDNQQIKLSTGLQIDPKLWNQTKRRAKRGAAVEATLNGALGKIEADVASVFDTLRVEKKQATPDTVREQYARQTGKLEARPKAPAVLDAYTEFIEWAGKRSQRPLRPASLAVHRTAKGHLAGFAKAYKGSFRLTWESLNGLFWEKFAHYLTKVIELNDTSLWKVVSTVRTFIEWAHKTRSYATDTSYQGITRTTIETGQKSAPVYLDRSEIVALMELDLSNDIRLARVRDTFVFQLHTGLRYSDIQALRPEHLQDDLISLVTIKNRRAITVPLLPEARRIWDMYEGKLPIISNQKQNKYLKELMIKAGIDSQHIVTDYKGGERIERTVAKSELIGTHSAKRTFVTILRQRGVSIEAICKITGNSRRTIETYIVNTADDAVREMKAAMA